MQYIHSPTKELATGSLTLCISLRVDCALEISLQTEITRFSHALKEGIDREFNGDSTSGGRKALAQFCGTMPNRKLAGAARFHLRNCVAPCIRNFPSGCKVVIPPSSPVSPVAVGPYEMILLHGVTKSEFSCYLRKGAW